MPQRPSKGRGVLRTWIAEWPGIAAALTISLITFAAATTFDSVRNWIWPPVPPYPVICTAEPVWLGGDKRLVEIYLVNTSREALTGDQLREKLRASLDEHSNASPAVLFRYQPGEPHAQTAVPDAAFNAGKGEVAVTIEPGGVRVELRQIDPLAILRVNVLFRVEAPDPEFNRAMKGTNGIFDLEGPEKGCFTR